MRQLSLCDFVGIRQGLTPINYSVHHNDIPPTMINEYAVTGGENYLVMLVRLRAP